MKKGKSNALLMELLIVALFFAIAAVVLVEVFAAAGNQARRADILSRAQFRVQEIAEQLYAAPDEAAALGEMGFSAEDGVWTLSLDDFTVTVTASRGDTPAGEMRRASVTATDGEGTLLSVPVSKYVSGEAAE